MRKIISGSVQTQSVCMTKVGLHKTMAAGTIFSIRFLLRMTVNTF